eukprot:6194644-Pleurochrysis_carterae.AAC.1
MQQKEQMEAEMTLLAERLNSHGLGGISGSLLDAQGYPRADVDVRETRVLRHQLAVRALRRMVRNPALSLQYFSSWPQLPSACTLI